MKRYIKTYFTCGLLLVGLLSACKEEDMTLGEGSVRLNVKVSDEVAVVSRAIDRAYTPPCKPAYTAVKGSFVITIEKISCPTY